MEKYIRKISMLLAAILFAVLLPVYPVHAADATVSVSGGGTVQEGDTVKVTVSVSCSESMLATELGVKYNSSVLTYSSASSGVVGGGSGVVKLTDTPGNSSATYTLTFKASASGSGNVEVIDCNVGTSTDQLVASGVGSTVGVTVSAPEAEASKDNSLSSLSISPGSLNPGFSPSVTKYTAVVANDVTKLTVSAVTSDSEAEITSVDGGDDLQVGTNTVSIVVTAKSGDKATYTITVTREGEAQETISESTGLEAAVGSEIYYVSEDFSETEIPEGFTETVIVYAGQEIRALINEELDLYLIYLVDENGENGAFYVYDIENDLFTPYIRIDFTEEKFIILLSAATMEGIPDGYDNANAAVDEYVIPALQKIPEAEEDEDEELSYFFLVYAVNDEGDRGLYSYDSKDETYQRFIETAAVMVDEDAVSEEQYQALTEQLKELQEKFNKAKSSRMIIICILIFLCAVLLFIVVNLMLKIRNMNDDRLDGGDDDDDSDPDDEAPQNDDEEVDNEFDFENDNELESDLDLPEEELVVPDPEITAEAPGEDLENSLNDTLNNILDEEMKNEDAPAGADDDDFNFEILDLDDDE